MEIIRKRKRRGVASELQDVDLKELVEKFGENIDYSETRKRTILYRKNLLCSKGTINYDNYLYIIGLNVKVKKEASSLFFFASKLLFSKLKSWFCSTS